MKVSLNTVKQFTAVDCSVNELVEKINRQLGSVDEVIDLEVRYKDAVIVKVDQCEKHPNADRLNICKVDDGGQNQDVPRDENGLIQVVCGAPNVRTGMFVVWLSPKSTVPASFEDKEPFVLDARELRGVLSQGMLASAKELAIGDDHDGILEINPDEWKPSDLEIKAGASFAEVYGLNDTIIDIENKMFTHRPDLFGQLGVAREIAGIQGNQFTSPDWYKLVPELAEATGLELSVHNDAQEKVPRFMAVAMSDVEVKSSPVWLQCELTRLGSKSINNIVDVTNYIMLLTAQPTHAYDYDKLRGHTLGTRFARAGETISLLNGKTYELDESDIVIVDAEGPVGLGGVMGGRDSEVSNDTKNIVIECATFDMYTIRKTSMRHGLFTDAVTRFNKGQSPLQNDRVLATLMNFDGMSGEQASEVFDMQSIDIAKWHEMLIGEAEMFDQYAVNQRLGLRLSDDKMLALLENVEISTCDDCIDDDHQDDLHVCIPFWRTDISQMEDIVEEVGRLYGYEKLPRELPLRSMKPTARSTAIETKQKIRESMKRIGANEVLTYSFVHKNVMERAEQDSEQAFRLGNALSPDLQYYRLTVLPSLLDKVHMNVKSGHDEFTLYEIGKGHNKKYHASDDEGLPSEMKFVDMVYTSKKPLEGAAFYRIRRQVESLASEFGREIVCLPINENLDYPVTAPFEQSRSAMIHTADTNEFLGMIGELKQSVLRSYKLPAYTAAATLDFEAFHSLDKKKSESYIPLSKYPKIYQDVSLRVSTDVYAQDIESIAKQAIVSETDSSLLWSLSPVSIYQAEDDDSSKTITYRLTVNHTEKTLFDSDVSELVKAIVVATYESHGAVQK